MPLLVHLHYHSIIELLFQWRGRELTEGERAMDSLHSVQSVDLYNFVVPEYNFEALMSKGVVVRSRVDSCTGMFCASVMISN